MINDLGRRLADGDDDAFSEVVRTYSRKVFALCYRLLRDEEDARDMAQEVFVRVFEKRRSFGAKSAIYTWIYRIALNMCFSELKRRKPAAVPLEDVEGVLAARDPEGARDTSRLEALVAASLDRLPPKQRSVFVMRFYDKMPFAEIADAVGTSVGAAKANFHFAVERLRSVLGESEAR
ncbi:MAG: sigma-70 family RNA polymerase sigma factor [bacterium]